MKSLVKLLSVFFAAQVLFACSSNSYLKRSDYDRIYSPAMDKSMSYSVYTPPNWDASESLPLMVLLHGARDNHESFDRYSVGTILDEQINTGKIPRIIIVSPDGELGFWENWHDGTKNYRDWIVHDLLPHVQTRYSTLVCPLNCFVSGISMGGHGALRFAYYEPETFSSVAAISAPIISKIHPGKSSFASTILKWLIPTKRIWGDIAKDNTHIPIDLDPYISWVNKKELINMPLLLSWGKKEGASIKHSNEHFQQFLEKNGKNHAWLVYDGAHKWVDWRKIIPQVIQFHLRSEINENMLKNWPSDTGEGEVLDKVNYEK